jgi:hypothetical protein
MGGGNKDIQIVKISVSRGKKYKQIEIEKNQHKQLKRKKINIKK